MTERSKRTVRKPPKKEAPPPPPPPPPPPSQVPALGESDDVSPGGEANGVPDAGNESSAVREFVREPVRESVSTKVPTDSRTSETTSSRTGARTKGGTGKKSHRGGGSRRDNITKKVRSPYEEKAYPGWNLTPAVFVKNAALLAADREGISQNEFLMDAILEILETDYPDIYDQELRAAEERTGYRRNRRRFE